MTELTQAYLKECLTYDPETGEFMWRERPRGHFAAERDWKWWNTRFAGQKAGNLNPSGYINIALGGRHYRAHRLAVLYMTGAIPKRGVDVDHINRVRDDNRWDNLRLVTRQENLRNAGSRSDNTSRVPGVCWHKRAQKWCAQIRVDGKRIHLGYFLSIEEAKATRIAAEIKYGYVPQNVAPREYLAANDSILQTA